MRCWVKTFSWLFSLSAPSTMVMATVTSQPPWEDPAWKLSVTDEVTSSKASLKKFLIVNLLISTLTWHFVSLTLREKKDDQFPVKRAFEIWEPWNMGDFHPGGHMQSFCPPLLAIKRGFIQELLW
jgi:hypothetical protein